QLAGEIKAPGYRLATVAGQVRGAVFLPHEIKPIPAYSGRPIAVLVAVAPDATILGVRILQHEEPVLVVGVKGDDLARFTDQCAGLNSWAKVRVNAQSREDYQGIDGITGATITAMVLNRSIMVSAQTVAGALGWPAPRAEADTPAAESRWAPWLERLPATIAMALALAVLLFILFFQDWLVRKTRLFRRLRIAYLVFTVVFIGYVFSAQLSIVNILGFIQTFKYGFTWETLILDPVIFLLWSFVAMSILFWGRGVFCGWLCPFGALQELVHKAATKLRFPSLQIPAAVHERMWTIKYIILIALVGVSLDSFDTAAAMAEVEPFKTV